MDRMDMTNSKRRARIEWEGLFEDPDESCSSPVSKRRALALAGPGALREQECLQVPSKLCLGEIRKIAVGGPPTPPPSPVPNAFGGCGHDTAS